MRYYVGKVMIWPMLPILYWQAGRIWKNMPKLPEANLDRVGQIGSGTKKLNLLAIGESTIAGVGVKSHKNGLAGFLASALSKQLQSVVQWKVMAKNGITVKETNEVIIPQLKPEPTDLILIGLGANDAFQRNSPRQWVSDIKKLIQNIRQVYPVTPIVFLNMPPIREFPAFTRLIKFFIGNLVDLLGDELAKVVHPIHNVWYFEERITYRHWINPNGNYPNKAPFFSDGVHPSAPTYKIWGNKLGEFVLENIFATAKN